MGDVLVASSLFTLLRQKFPDAELHFMIDKKHQDILKNNPEIDQFVFFEDSFSANLKLIKSQKYDAIVDVYSKIGTALLSILSGVKKTSGYRKSYLSFLYTDPISRKKEPISKETALAIEHRQQVLEPLGIQFSKVFPKIYLSEEEKSNARQLLQKFGVDFSKPIAMISTFGSTPEKTYPFMKEVLEDVAQFSNVQILCNYLPSQKEDFKSLFESLNSETKSKIVLDFDTKNLREFIAVTSFCTILIGNEGGATNVSKALGVPTFGIFAPYVDKKTWAWAEDGVKNTSIHVHDYIQTSESYADLKPELFIEKLHHWLSDKM